MTYVTQGINEVNIQMVSIISVNPAADMAVGYTRQETEIRINTSYYVGSVRCVPAVGEQWYISRYRGEWRLHSRIPYHTVNQLISPTQGQTLIGSSGPTEINGSAVNIRSDVMTLNGISYRDNGMGLQRLNANGQWETISSAPATMPSENITDSTVLGRLLLTAPDVATVLSLLGLAVAGAGVSGGSASTPNDDPAISGGSVSGPALGADLDGGTPEGTGDIFVSGGTPEVRLTP